MIQSVGSDKKISGSNFNSLIEKINSSQRKWKVLEDDEEDEEAEEIDAGTGFRIAREWTQNKLSQATLIKKWLLQHWL